MKNILIKSFLALLLGVLPIKAKAEVVWYPLPAEAYKFGDKYPEAQRLLFAFDYGHALIYERLLLLKGKTIDNEAFEKQMISDIITILKDPPKTKIDEGDIAPNYVYKFPLTVNLFDWSHMLHQFVLDILATSADRGDGMKARINELYAQYNANERLKITEVCKTMMFMDGHYFSKSFRKNFPSFNLLIWSYHWFQIKLYEALMAPTEAKRDANVKVVVSQFWDLISDLPDSADFDMMPETAVEAPTFAKMFPIIPGAFDNNHMLHDVISDILISDKVTADKMKAEGIRFARMAQDPEAFKSNKCGQ